MNALLWRGARLHIQEIEYPTLNGNLHFVGLGFRTPVLDDLSSALENGHAIPFLLESNFQFL